MTRRRHHHWRGLALAAMAAFIVGVLALHVIWPLPGQEGYWPWPLGLMAFPVTAAVLLIKRPGNGVGRALGLVAIATLFTFLPWWYAVTYLDSPLSPYVELLNEVAALAQFWAMAALLYVFPTGRPLNVWGRRALSALVVVAIASMLLFAVSQGPMVLTQRPNPLGVAPAWTRDVAYVAFSTVALFAIGGIATLVLRRLRGGVEERAQLRWFLVAAVCAVVTLFSLDNVLALGSRWLGDLVPGLIAATAFWSLPTAIAVAVLKYKLYEIDRLVSRTVSYAVVVGALAVVYAGGVFLLGGLLPLEGEVAVAGSTLAVAALFTPLRRRVQRRVDRRFNRSRYGVELELRRFEATLRDSVDPDGAAGGMVAVATVTMQPTTIGMWLRAVER